MANPVGGRGEINIYLERAKLTVLARPYEPLFSLLVGTMLQHAPCSRLSSGPNVSVQIPQPHPARGIAPTPAHSGNIKWKFAAVLACTALAACTTIPAGRTAVNSVDIEGSERVDDDEIEQKIATKETPRFLGLFRGVVYEYSIFNPYTFQEDLKRIERYYQARGYYDAKVRASRVDAVDKDHVRVVIEVEEGSPVIVGVVQVRGLEGLAPDVANAANRASRALGVGKPFDEETYEQVETDIRRALTDRGYAYAQVQRVARVDAANHVAGAWYDVTPGPKAFFGEITIEADRPVHEDLVLRTISIRTGDPYSTSDLEEARNAILGLGVFSNVDIESKLESPPPDDRIVPLIVHLSGMPLRSVQLGGGVELDVIRTDVHLRAQWEHLDFLGGYRRFGVELKPGVVLYPTRLPSLQGPSDALPEIKSRVDFRQPGFIEHRTNANVRVEYNIFPLLLSPKVDPDASVIGYRELKSGAGIERSYGHLFSSLYYRVQRNAPFAYVGARDKDLGPVTISYLDLWANLDFRNDSIHPHKGVFIGGGLQFAGLGGDARDIRLQPEARFYIPLARKVTVALRGALGFLFPFNYAETLDANSRYSSPPSNVSRPRWVEDTQLVYFRGLFSGGSNSNRGYPLRGIGPHGAIPFFVPGVAADALRAGCSPTGGDADSVRCKQPLGGLSLWEASGEIRFPLKGPLTGAAFCDMSDVSPSQVDIRLKYLHLSCGPGARYDTPVGPVRVDIGVRIPRMQILGQSDQNVAGHPGTIFGLPIAVALSIGEAF